MKNNIPIPLLDRSKRLAITASHFHETINILIGLWSLMKLQYDQEGHINTHVSSLFEQTLFGHEEDWSVYLREIDTEDIPF